MNKKLHKDTMSYYSTLLQQYKVDDNLLDTRTKKRAIGSVLEQIDKQKVKSNQKLDKARLKKLRRAFNNASWFKKIAASLTFATAIALFQAPPLEATIVTSNIVKEKDNFLSVSIDGDSSKQALQKDDNIHSNSIETSSLHFISNKKLFNDYKLLEEDSVLLDDDSDVSYTPNTNTNSLTVIDTTIDDWETLAKSVSQGSIVLLNKDDNALDTILSELKKLKTVDSLNIISHGSSGQLHFSNKTISKETLELNKAKWEELGTYLDKDGDINLFGCNVAQGDKGKEFIETLASFTQADVAASLNPTGNTSKGGDWKLEMAVGTIKDSTIFKNNILSSFSTILGSVTIDFTGLSHSNVNGLANKFTVGNYTLYVNDGNATTSKVENGYLYMQNPVDINQALYFFVTNTNGEAFYVEEVSIKWADADGGHDTDNSVGVWTYSGNPPYATPAGTYINGSYLGDYIGADHGISFYSANFATPVAATAYFSQASDKIGSTTGIAFNTGSTGEPSYVKVSSIVVNNPNAPANTAPEVDLDGDDSTGNSSGGAIRTFTENGGAVTIADTDVSVTDAQTDTITTITVTLTNPQDGASEGLNVSAAAQNALTGISGKSDVTLQNSISITGATATLAQVETFLEAITYNNTSEDPDTTARTVTVVINDGTDNSTSVTSNISVSKANDAPTNIALSSSTVGQSGGTNATVGTLSSTDVDASDTHTYSLVSNGTSANGSCGVGSDADNGSFNLSSNTLRANNSSSLSAGTYKLCVQTNDSTTTFEKAFTITVSDDVDPTVSTYSPTVSATDIAVTSNLVLTFSENVVKGTGNIVIKRYNDDVTLQTIDVTSGSVTVNNNQVTIVHSTDFNLNTQYYIQVASTAFDDSNGNSFAGISSKDTWKFTTVSNNVPVTTLPAAPTIHEDATNVAFADTIQIADGDGDNQTVTLTATNGTLSLTTTGLSFTTGDGTDDATMSFSGTLTAINTALDSLTFTPTANYSGSATLRVQTSDGNASDDDTLTLTVLDAPEITSIVRGTPSAENTNADSLTFKVNLVDSNITTDATTADFEVIGTTTATVTSVTRQSTFYEVVVSGGDLASYNGTVGLKFVDDNSVLNSNGVPIGGDGIDHFTTGETYTVDNVSPTTTISNIDISADTGSSDSDFLTKTASQTITATLSTTLAVGEVLKGSIDGGSNWIDITSKVSGSSVSWDGVTLSGTSSIKLKVTDAALNDGAVATQNYTLDTTSPTITISTIASDDKINATEDDVNITISGTTTGAEDGQTVSINVGGTALSTSVSSNAWSTTLSSAQAQALSQGNISVTADVSDIAGNSATQVSKTIVYDNTAPIISISTIASDDQIDATEDDANITISGTTTGVEDGQTVSIDVGGTALSTNVSSNAWSTTLTPTQAQALSQGDLSVTADVSDIAGNSATQASKTIAYDGTVPTIVITSDKDTLIAGETATITFTLSEASSDFTSDDVTVSGGELTNFATTSSTVYTATFTPTTNSTTNATIDVSASKFTDAIGNDNSQATQKVLTIDTVIPTISISSNKTTAINGEVLNLSFTLSEDSTDFTSDDISVVGGAISNFAQDNTNTKLYTAKLTIDDTTTSQATIDVAADKFQDATGNPNTAATQQIITILPSVLEYTPSVSATSVDPTTSLILKFSEEVSVGTGNILIREYSNDNIIETIPVTDPLKVVVENPSVENGLTNTQVTINTSVNLGLNTQYYVIVPNTALKDVDDNFFIGVNAKDLWKFTTTDNRAPSITSNGAAATATINVDENQTAVTTVTATDLDVGQTITYSISGTDANSFDINSSTGVLTFDTAPNYETKNTYSVVVTAIDDGGGNLSDSQTLTINVDDVNDAPIINIANSLSTLEDNAKDISFTYTDEDSDTVTAVEKTSPNNGSISIGTNKITYTPNADYNGSDSFTVTFSDGNGSSEDKTVSVTVTPFDDAPVISTNLTNQSENEDGKGLVITLTTTDVDNDLNTTPATYTASSSDTSIAIAYIQNGKLIVVPQPNANGTVTITVTTTVNGKSSSKTFTYTLVSVNDAPTISNIADISHDQSSSAINKTITFDIWDDVDVTSLSATSSNTNLLANSDIQVNKLSSTKGELTYTISANNAGTTIVEVVARDTQGLEYKESFTINIQASNDALCVENTNTALVFDTIKLANVSQDAITSDLDLVNSIDSVCSTNIAWSISDTSVLNLSGVITPAATDKTITATATIEKGQFTAKKIFLLTVVNNTLTDTQALDKLTFELIKNENEGRYKVISKLNLLDTFLGKTVTWSVDDESVISPYSGYVTRGVTDTNIVLTATIGAQTKTFNLTVLKEESSDLDKVTKDAQLLTINSILGLNKDANNIIYNLTKPLPSTASNGSTITWNSSNENYITNAGDVLRDENADKHVVLTATITNGTETTTKEFMLLVLQNKIESDDGTTFKNATNTPNGIDVTTTNNGNDTTTSASFTNTILNIVEEIVSEDSINNIIEFTQKVVNVYLNTDGTTQTTYQGEDGVNSSIQTKAKGTTTSVDDNGNVETTNGSVSLKLNSDGSVEHQVTNGALNTKATSNIENSNVKEDESGNVETTSEVTQGGFVYKAVATTNPQGETTTKFIRIDLSTGEQDNLDKTTSDATPYPAGNDVEISQINGVLYIKTTTPLDGQIIIE